MNDNSNNRFRHGYARKRTYSPNPKKYMNKRYNDNYSKRPRFHNTLPLAEQTFNKSWKSAANDVKRTIVNIPIKNELNEDWDEPIIKTDFNNNNNNNNENYHEKQATKDIRYESYKTTSSIQNDSMLIKSSSQMSLSQTSYSKYSLVIDDREIDQEIAKLIKIYEKYNRSKYELKKCELQLENLKNDEDEYKKLPNLIAKHRSDTGSYLAQLNKELVLREINKDNYINDKLKKEQSYLCKLCSCSFNDIKEYLEHLSSNFHCAKMELAGDYKIRQVCQNNFNLNDSPLKGYQFIQPCKSFFCSICNELFSDANLCELHLNSLVHHQKFNELIEKQL